MSTPATQSGATQQQCDLVMKGGITSGIVYPPLFDVLHDNGYRFRNVGGTSAGAIAAAVTAAAQMGGEPGFKKLRAVTKWLGEGDNLLNLFKPTGSTKPLFKTFLAYSKHKLFGLTPLRIYGALLLGDTLIFLLGLLLGLGMAYFSAWLVGGELPDPRGLSDLRWGFWIHVIFWVVVGTVAACAVHMYLILTKRIPKNFFGICTGRDPKKFDDTALTDWLYLNINDLAGKGKDPTAAPLTFGDLWAFPAGEKPQRKNERNIDLKMVTSNLSQNQPYVLPFEKSTFIFKEEEFRKLFPPSVVDHMLGRQPRLEGFALPPGYFFLPPAKELPVIVATRMSLSFPVLLSMVPLYTVSRSAFAEEMRFEFVPPKEGQGPYRVVLSRKIIRRLTERVALAGAPDEEAGRGGPGEVISEDEAQRFLRAQAALTEALTLRSQHGEETNDEKAREVQRRIGELESEAKELSKENEFRQLNEAAQLTVKARGLRAEARALMSEAIAVSSGTQSDEQKAQAKGLHERARKLVTEAQEQERAIPQTCALRVSWEPVGETYPLSEKSLQKNWFSDGGICSNFPIQFFDAWLPTRPTFGVNLTSQLEKGEPTARGGGVGGDARLDDEQAEAVRRRSAYVMQTPSGYGEREMDVYDKDVYLPKPDSVLAPEWIPIPGLGKFLESVFSTAQNYRDNMQALLPSYRERIVQIRLSDNEGGLNLNMPPEVIKAVMKKGRDAGQVLSTEFNFDQHQWVRFRVLMKKMEESLVRMDEVMRAHQIYYDIANDMFDPSTYPYDPRDATWLPRVSVRLRDIGAVINAFNPDDLFNEDPQPFPEPELRVTPEL